MILFAGSSESGRGLLHLSVVDPASGEADISLDREAPAGVGPLRITGVRGAEVDLEGAEGWRGVFHLEAGTLTAAG